MIQQDCGRDRAWELYCERGVIIPEYASEIAARRAVKRQWETEEEPLR